MLSISSCAHFPPGEIPAGLAEVFPLVSLDAQRYLAPHGRAIHNGTTGTSRVVRTSVAIVSTNADIAYFCDRETPATARTR